MANRYSVLLKFLENSNSHSKFEFEGKKKLSQLPIRNLYAMHAPPLKKRKINKFLFPKGKVFKQKVRISSSWSFFTRTKGFTCHQHHLREESEISWVVYWKRRKSSNSI